MNLSDSKYNSMLKSLIKGNIHGLKINGAEIATDEDLQEKTQVWYVDEDPTLENAPYVGWGDGYAKHDGDLCHSSASGNMFRFSAGDGSPEWVLLQDRLETGVGEDTVDDSRSYARIDEDGTLIAKNARISGTVYAKNGEFSGDVQIKKEFTGGKMIATIGETNVFNTRTQEFETAQGFAVENVYDDVADTVLMPKFGITPVVDPATDSESGIYPIVKVTAKDCTVFHTASHDDVVSEVSLGSGVSMYSRSGVTGGLSGKGYDISVSPSGVMVTALANGGAMDIANIEGGHSSSEPVTVTSGMGAMAFDLDHSANSYKINGHNSAIGSKRTVVSNHTNHSTTSGNTYSIGSGTLPSGTWLVMAAVYWGANANGNRFLKIGSTATDINQSYGRTDVRGVGAANAMMQNLTTVITVDTTTTFYLNCMQNSGASVNAAGELTAVRLL